MEKQNKTKTKQKKAKNKTKQNKQKKQQNKNKTKESNVYKRVRVVPKDTTAHTETTHIRIVEE